MVEMFSASSMLVHRSGSIQGPILRHAMFYAVGFMTLMIVQLVDFKYIRLLGYVGLAASWLLLLYTTFFGKNQHNLDKFCPAGKKNMRTVAVQPSASL